MSNSTNVTKQVETTAPYTSSTNANLLACMVNTSINGVSPTSQSIVSRSLDSTDYTNLVQAKQQDGIFTSKTDKKIFTIDSNLDFEFNPIKSLESNIGISYNYVSNLAAEDKDNRVQKDNIPASPYPSYGPEIYSGTNSNSPDVFIATPARNPPCIISESRTGTASYTQINERGVFSEGKEVEIRVLTSPNNYSFGTSQNFDQIEPRGSQTPQRYYNHNSGRTLSFVAEFHQQEYPLEPLLSIAEKAQYLARPYKHGDYALIPKLVMVQIPGRVFRGYLQSVSINTSGDDYSNWNFIDIKSKVGTMGEQEGFYGGYNSRELEPIGGISNDRKDIMTDNQNVYYGLSKMTIDFTLLIVEDIVLTTYETQEEIAEKERIQQEEERKRKEELERQIAIDQARGYVELHKSVMDGTYIDDCIYVDPKTGEIIGVKFIDSDENEIDTTNGREGITLTEWEKQQEIKKGDTVEQNTTADIIDAGTQEAWNIINDSQSVTSMRTYLEERWVQEHPEPQTGTPEHQAWEAEKAEYETKLDNVDFLEAEYKQKAITEGVGKDNSDVAYFTNGSFYMPESGKPQTNLPLPLSTFLKTDIKSTEDIHTVLTSIETEKSDPNIVLNQIEKNGWDDSWSYHLLWEVCCVNGVGIKTPTATTNKYGLHDWHIPNPIYFNAYNRFTGFIFQKGDQGIQIRNNFKECGIEITEQEALLYFETIKDSGYCDKENDNECKISFYTLAKITDFTKFLVLVDDQGTILKTPDNRILLFFMKAIGAVRSAFYSGFKKICSEKITEDGAELFPNKKSALDFMNTRVSSQGGEIKYAYYWEYKP